MHFCVSHFVYLQVEHSLDQLLIFSKILKLIICNYILTSLFQVSLFLNGSMYGMDDVLICQDTWAGTSKVVYTAVSQLAQFFVPVIIVICLYLSIYLKLKNRPQVC